MQKYPVARVALKELNLASILSKAEMVFGTATETDGFVHASFGALKDLKVGVEKGSLLVETIMDPSVSPEQQAETVRRYNAFLEKTTGLTSKQRAKRLQAEAKKGLPGG